MTQQEISPDSVLSAGSLHIAKTAHTNFLRVAGVLKDLESYWSGVRYIRSALLQQAEGTTHIDLAPGLELAPVQLPTEISAIWQNDIGENRDDGKHLKSVIGHANNCHRRGIDGNFDFTLRKSV